MTDTDLHEGRHDTTAMPQPAVDRNGYPGGPGRPPEGRGNAGRWIGTAVVAMVLGFAGGVAGYAVADNQSGNDSGSGSKSVIGIGDGAIVSPKSSKTQVANNVGTLTPAQVYQAASPAVVHIRAEVSVQSNSIFGVPQQQQGEATGSG
ncbi:MAG: hypothetical protein H7123_03280, partial [Thermoleophilia bacterium]|nr:hypothetical protein [Thermoleophilia bacterium]